MYNIVSKNKLQKISQSKKNKSSHISLLITFLLIVNLARYIHDLSVRVLNFIPKLQFMSEMLIADRIVKLCHFRENNQNTIKLVEVKLFVTVLLPKR